MNDGQQLWQQYIAGVTPLKTHNRSERPSVSRPNHSHKPTHTNPVADTPQESNIRLHALIGTALNSTPTQVCGANFVLRYASNRASRSDIALMKRATKGQMPMRQVLDLHGMTVVQSKVAVRDTFVQMCDMGDVYLQLIHGKGTMQIKRHVCHWLPRLPFVTAAYSIIDAQIQSGALFIKCKW